MSLARPEANIVNSGIKRYKIHFSPVKNEANKEILPISIRKAKFRYDL